jgi:hypothetical protein
VIGVALVASAVAIGTYGFGWLAVPVIGLAVGAARISARPVTTAGAAGLLGWAVLLVYGATRGPVVDLAGLLGDVLGAPGAVVVVLTLAYPALLAGAAAGVGAGLRAVVARDGSRVP